MLLRRVLIFAQLMMYRQIWSNVWLSIYDVICTFVMYCFITTVLAFYWAHSDDTDTNVTKLWIFAVGVGLIIFLTKPPKGTSLPDFTRFEPLSVQIASGVFPLGEATKKMDTTKSQRGYISPICGEFPTQPNFTKIGIWVGVADIINHTRFGNDRSREY